jgi:hypothetical protein
VRLLGASRHFATDGIGNRQVVSLVKRLKGNLSLLFNVVVVVVVCF